MSETDQFGTHKRSTVTITISREDAAWWSARDSRSAGVYERNIATACRAAL